MQTVLSFIKKSLICCAFDQHSEFVIGLPKTTHSLIIADVALTKATVLYFPLEKPIDTQDNEYTCGMSN